jgi:hypothetical protein
VRFRLRHLKKAKAKANPAENLNRARQALQRNLQLVRLRQPFKVLHLEQNAVSPARVDAAN